MMDEYQDLIYKPHHVSLKHHAMSVHDRAGQFTSFAALAGYEKLIEEAGRYTEKELELGEDDKRQLDEKLRMIIDYIKDTPEVRIIYFVKDEEKSGGVYRSLKGLVKKIDLLKRCIKFADGKEINLEKIIDISIITLYNK